MSRHRRLDTSHEEDRAVVLGVGRVAVVQNQVLLAESLTLALAGRGFVTSAVPVPEDELDPQVLLEPILALRPSVVVLDSDLGETRDAMTLVRPLRRAGCAVVVVTPLPDDERWGQALALGASAILSASDRLEKLISTLRHVAAGEDTTGTTRRIELIQNWQRRQLRKETQRARLAQLTRREREVLGQLAEGERVGDIARGFHVSEATVRTQVKSILSKLGVNSQIAAVAVIRELRWRQPS
jgi:DNA-binding NarL/FixJ family response regulator